CVVIRYPNDAEAFERPQKIRIDPGIRLHRARLQLIDVALSLRVQTPPSDISYLEDGVEPDLSLGGEAPVPRLRVLEDRILSGDDQREDIPGCAPRVIDSSSGNRCGRLQWRITSEEDRIANAQTSEKSSRPSAEDSLIVDRVGDADPRLEVPLVNRRVLLVHTAEQEVEFSGVGDSDSPVGRLGEPTAGNHNAIVAGFKVAPGDEPGSRILCNRDRGIIEPLVEHDHVLPEAVIRLNYGVPEPDLESKIRLHLPGILDEPLEHMAAVWRE